MKKHGLHDKVSRGHFWPLLILKIVISNNTDYIHRKNHITIKQIYSVFHLESKRNYLVITLKLKL